MSIYSIDSEEMSSDENKENGANDVDVEEVDE